MIRNLLVAILFFFGPALLMFLLRNILLLLRLYLWRQRQRRMQPEVIDITPIDEKRTTPRWFYLLAAVLGLIAAVSIFNYLQSIESSPPKRYVPAHLGEDGRIIPGHWEEIPEQERAPRRK